MDLRLLSDQQKSIFNSKVTHIVQSWEWGETREKLEIPLSRYGIYKGGKLSQTFQLTFHKIPFTNQYVGYLPKGPFPDQELAQALREIGKQRNCAFIKIEPNIETSLDIEQLVSKAFRKSPKPLFTKFNYIIDLTKSEDELLKNMHPKSRYNIKVALKHHVKVAERTDDEAFEIYLKLYFETTRRQKYHGHNEAYHTKVWQVLKDAGIATLLIAFYTPEGEDKPIPLTAWMLFNFKDTLYYPYGGSSIQYRNVMSNTLVAWEAVKLGQKLGCKKFDLWGSLGTDANPKDPWYGFTDFKRKLGGELVEYIGSYDLVRNWPLYLTFTAIDKLTPLKIFLLKLVGK